MADDAPPDLDQLAAEAAAAEAAKPVRIILKKTDAMGSARTFKAICEEHNVFFVEWRETFYRWNGQIYTEISDKEMRNTAWRFLDSCYVKAADQAGLPIEVKYEPNNICVSNLVNALSALIGVPSKKEAPDWIVAPPGSYATQDIVACRNGLYHIPTGTLLAHTRNFFCLGISDIDVNLQAPQPARWLKLLAQAFPDDQAAIDNMQEMFGYLISTDTSQQKIFALNGVKRAGKSTIMNVLTLLVGQTNTTTATIKGICERFGLGPMIGKKLCLFPDAVVGTRTDLASGVGTMKSVSGEDAQNIDRKNKSHWQGKLPTRMVIASNELLALVDNSGTLASRLLIFDFTVSFFGNEDAKLFETLKQEASGIFNWAMAGRKRLSERGRFAPHAKSEETVKEMAGLGSPIISFVDDRCNLRVGAITRTSTLYSSYKDWCSHNGLHPASSSWFGRSLKGAYPKLNPTKPNYEDGKQYPSYEGIEITT